MGLVLTVGLHTGICKWAMYGFFPPDACVNYVKGQSVIINADSLVCMTRGMRTCVLWCFSTRSSNILTNTKDTFGIPVHANHVHMYTLYIYKLTQDYLRKVIYLFLYEYDGQMACTNVWRGTWGMAYKTYKLTKLNSSKVINNFNRLLCYTILL